MARTLKEVYKELVSSPFFPLLFIGKAVETAGFWLIGSSTMEEVAVMTVLGVVATVLWAVSDSVDINVDREGIIGD